MKPRTRARWLALQVLYEYDMTGHPPGEILQSRLEDEAAIEPIEDEVVAYCQLIVNVVVPLSARLDEIIAQYATEWPLDQVAAIDRNVLRIALWEFAVQKSTPTKVAINEAVEAAKAFGSDSSPRFVNGVLGSFVGKVEHLQLEPKV